MLSETKTETFELSDGTVLSGDTAEKLNYLADTSIETSEVYTQDELGMSLLFNSFYGTDWFCCRETGIWYRWDGLNWNACLDDSDLRRQLTEMYSIIRIYIMNAKADGNKIGTFAAFIRTMCTAKKLRAVVEILALKLSRNAKNLDGQPYIINTPERAFDLLTHKSVDNEVRKDYYLTLKTAVNAAGKRTTCPEWDRFIDEIMSGDEEKKSFLQRALGYSILGDNREECMFIAYGPKTRNGKGTLFSAVQNALGRDYACSAPADLICGGRKPVDVNAPSPLLAGYNGKRLITMSESNREIRLNSALIKTLTGRDEISVRGLYGRPFTYVPQFTLWLSTNHLPEIDDPSVFASERIRVIEFNEHFGEDRQNKDLKRIFSTPEAASYIMKWLLVGAIDYVTNGLNVPACVKEATKKYEKRSDTIACFIEDRCITGSDRRVLRPYLYRTYRNWCNNEDSTLVPLSAKALVVELENRGFEYTKIRGEYFVKGIDIRMMNGYDDSEHPV